MSFNNKAKLRIIFGSIGFSIAAALVIYQVLFDYAALRPIDSLVLSVGFVVCPPSFLAIPLFVVLFEIAETGTPTFYVIWFVLGLLNALFYSWFGPWIVGLFKDRKALASNPK
jgi:hypothetical protein